MTKRISRKYSNGELQNLIMHIPGYIYIKNVTGIYIACNDQQAQYLGFKTGSDVIGKNDFDLPWSASKAREVNLADSKVIEKGMVTITEEIIKSGGKHITVLNQKAPFVDDNGNIIGIICTAIDITEKREREEQTWILEDIIGKMPGHVWWKDRNCKFLGCNDHQARTAGLQSRYEIKGQRAYDIISGEQPEAERIKQAHKIDKIDKKIIESGIGSIIEEPLILPDGSEAIYLSNKQALRDRGGNIIGLIGIAFDITDRKESERLRFEQAIDKQMLLEQSKFHKTVDQVVHDIRSPLASLDMLVKICSDIPEEYRVTLRDIATRINDIASNLLNQYTASRNLVTNVDERMPLLLSTCLSELLADKKYEYQNLPVKFELSFMEDSRFTFIDVEIVSFKRAISNLINNGVDSLAGKSGHIVIKLDVIDNKVKIYIKDNGSGMPDEVITKILNDVVVTSGKADGHGVGLTQVREMLQRNKGNLSIESKLDHGTTITLTFPRIAVPLWLADRIELNKDDIVVILDDDPSIHRAWNSRFMLNFSDIRLKHFERGDEAIQFINSLSDEEKRKIFLLSDYELLKQNMNGLDIITSTAVTRAVLVTSHYANKSVIKKATEIGVKLLPKMLASEVIIQIQLAINKVHDLKKVDMVLIEDDRILAKTIARYVPKDKVINLYHSPQDLLANVEKYSRDTKIVFDNSFDESDMTGIQLGEHLYNMGFVDLCLYTGTEFKAGQLPPYFKVISKANTEDIIQLVMSL